MVMARHTSTPLSSSMSSAVFRNHYCSVHTLVCKEDAHITIVLRYTLYATIPLVMAIAKHRTFGTALTEQHDMYTWLNLIAITYRLQHTMMELEVGENISKNAWFRK